MSNYAQLRSQLKALKLSGIADTLELRIMEAQNNQLSFSELISMLLVDELETRQNRKLQRLITHARLDASKTLESFDFSFNPSINASLIRELATCRFIEKGENIFLVGPTGTGKTHLAQAFSHRACRQMLTVEFHNFHDLFSMLHNADLSGRIDRVIKSLLKADLLVIDDFAFKKIDQKSAEYLYNIADARYRQKPVILTSNRSMNDWVNIFPDPIMANALMDRLAHNAHQIIIKGESFRKKFRPEIQNA
jgi:DNA replication protein DnaC